MSESLYSALGQEISTLRACLTDALPAARVIEEYEFRQAAALAVPTLTVGVQAVRLSERYLSAIAGRADGAITTAAGLEVDFAVTVHCPIAQGGGYARMLMTQAADALRYSQTFGFCKLVTGPKGYDRSSRCLRLPIIVTARYLL